MHYRGAWTNFAFAPGASITSIALSDKNLLCINLSAGSTAKSTQPSSY